MTGLYFDDLQVGQKIVHPRARTITETDNLLFCGLTENTQPLHLDDEFARNSGFQGRIVNGLFTMSLVVGLTVPDLTEGTIVANLGYERVEHTAPVYAGDTISVETEVLEKRTSESKPDRGIVKLRHTGRKQDGTDVVQVERTVLFLRNR
jgi:itaconyl-CoA hydratase